MKSLITLKDMTRRSFLLFAGLLVPASGLLRSARSKNSILYPSVQVEYASAFFAPFVVDDLKPGRALDLLWKSDRAMLALGKDLLGSLPKTVAENCRQAAREARHIEVCVERVERDEQGRLLLFVHITG